MKGLNLVENLYSILQTAKLNDTFCVDFGETFYQLYDYCIGF